MVNDKDQEKLIAESRDIWDANAEAWDQRIGGGGGVRGARAVEVSGGRWGSTEGAPEGSTATTAGRCRPFDGDGESRLMGCRRLH